MPHSTQIRGEEAIKGLNSHHQTKTARMRASRAAYKHWLHSAPRYPRSIALCTDLNLSMSRVVNWGFIAMKTSVTDDIGSGFILMYPMRRLVISGEDTAYNFLLLFGPTWEQGTAWVHRQARLEALLGPAPGTARHTAHTVLDEDKVGEDGVKIKIKSPNKKEDENVKNVRQLRRRMGIDE